MAIQTRGLSMVACCLALAAAAGAGEYPGRFTPDANYVLSGQLARDLPPLPDVPFHYVREGYAAERLSEVPPVGTHPRVALSPSDIEAIRRKAEFGEKADRVFRVMYRELRNAAARPGPGGPFSHSINRVWPRVCTAKGSAKGCSIWVQTCSRG